MAAPSTQYLQVPKALPYRKLRSRSKSRSREPTPATTTPPPGSPKIRSHSPPIPPIQSPNKASVSGFAATAPATSAFTMPNNQPAVAHGPMSSHIMRPPSPPTKVASEDTDSKPSNGINYEDLNGDLYTLQRWVTPPIEEQEKRQLGHQQVHSKSTWQAQEPQYTYIPLRERLVGCWKLESYTAFPTPESTVQRPTYPMTRNVTGMILYTPDGYMSAQMLIPGQQSFKRGEGAEPQWAEAAKRSFTYCGPYYISDEGSGREEILRHTFQVCNLPGWIGDIQVRTCRFEEDGQVLVLGSEEPTEIKGDKRIPVLKWRRARDNAQGVPPPPMPQIKISGPGEP